jgi:cell wall-associated NlpC family hydrolase
MIQRVLLFALASVFFLSPQLQAERTPQDTYRDTRAKLRKFWQGEEKLILGIIRGQEKHVANLNQRYRKTAPKFVKIRANIQKNLKQAQARLAESRSYLSKRRQEVPKKIEEAAQKAANTHRELIARGEDAKQQIEAAVAQAQRDIAHKLEKAKAEVEAGMSELRQRAEAARRKIESDLDRFKAKVDAAVSDLEKKNQQVTARYRVRYDLSRIETNLGGKKQTVSIGRLAKLHLGGNPKAPLIPRELIEQLRELPWLGRWTADRPGRAVAHADHRWATEAFAATALHRQSCFGSYALERRRRGRRLRVGPLPGGFEIGRAIRGT